LRPTQELDALGEAAEDNSGKLGGEVKRLHAHFRRRLVSICGGIMHMLIILLVFLGVVIFMRLAPRRFNATDILASSSTPLL